MLRVSVLFLFSQAHLSLPADIRERHMSEKKPSWVSLSAAYNALCGDGGPPFCVATDRGNGWLSGIRATILDASPRGRVVVYDDDMRATAKKLCAIPLTFRHCTTAGDATERATDIVCAEHDTTSNSGTKCLRRIRPVISRSDLGRSPSWGARLLKARCPIRRCRRPSSNSLATLLRTLGPAGASLISWVRCLPRPCCERSGTGPHRGPPG